MTNKQPDQNIRLLFSVEIDDSVAAQLTTRQMDIERILNFVTPFRLVSLIGILAIAQGFVHMDQRDNILQFIFGIPLAAGMLGFDYLMRRATRNNTRYLWLIEAIIVAFMWYGFNHS